MIENIAIDDGNLCIYCKTERGTDCENGFTTSVRYIEYMPEINAGIVGGSRRFVFESSFTTAILVRNINGKIEPWSARLIQNTDLQEELQLRLFNFVYPW